MNKGEFDQEFMEKYLLDKLSPSEKQYYEEQLSGDPLLRSELDFQKEVFQIIQLIRKSELKERLNRIEIWIEEDDPLVVYFIDKQKLSWSSVLYIDDQDSIFVSHPVNR